MNQSVNSFADEEMALRSRILEFTSTILGLLVAGGILTRHYAVPTTPLAIIVGLSTGAAFVLVAVASRSRLLSFPNLVICLLFIAAFGMSALSVTGMGFISPVLAALIALPIVGSSLMGVSGALWGAVFTAIALFSVYFIETSQPPPSATEIAGMNSARLVVFLFLTAAAVSLTRAIDGSREYKERKLRELNNALEKEKKKAEHALKIRSSFLANMSHEIRTPINGILGMAILLKDDVNDEALEKLNIIESSGDILLNLIDDILDFSKMDSGVLLLESIPLNLRLLCTKVQESLQPLADEKGLEIELDIDNSVHEWIYGDPTKLAQVLLNLIGNAIKYSGGHNVRVCCHSQINDSDELVVQVAVKDSGVGIPESLQSRLFKPFSQVDSSTTRKYGGTGLGLAISKSIIEQMGGTIGVDSTTGVGSTFHFNFLSRPATNPNLDEQIQIINGSNPVHNPLPAPLRILVAEDNEVNRKVVKGFLDKLGQQADFAIDGLEALAKVKTTEYDLILMDCHMPNLDGFEATQKIKRLALKHRPFIAALTASAMKEDRERCVRAGMDGFIAKPLRYEDLLSLCNQISKKQLVT